MKIMDNLLNDYFNYVCLPLRYPFKWLGMAKSQELGYSMIWAIIVFPILLMFVLYWSFS